MKERKKERGGGGGRKVGRKERKKKRRQKERERKRETEKEREGGWKKRKEKQKEQQGQQQTQIYPLAFVMKKGETASPRSPYGFSVFLMSFLSPFVALVFCRKIQSPQQKGHPQQSLLQETVPGAMPRASPIHLQDYRRDTSPPCGSASRACRAEALAPEPASLGRINYSLPRKN